MSVIHSRALARKIARRRVGLGFLDHRKGYGPKAIPSCTLRLTEQKSLERRVIYDRTPGPAARMPPLKNAATARGFTFFKDTIVYHESELEHRVSLRLQARNDIARLYSQYPVFTHLDDDGKPHQHTADFCVVFNDGFRQAVVVKKETKREAIEDLIRRISAHPSANQVDGIVLRTEKYGSIDALENAMMVRWSREYHDQDDVDELLEVVSDLHGWFRFGSLLRDCVSIERRRVAVWRLIDAGILFSVTGEKITEMSFLGHAPAGGPTGLCG
jgi:hypothetical protein